MTVESLFSLPGIRVIRVTRNIKCDGCGHTNRFVDHGVVLLGRYLIRFNPFEVITVRETRMERTGIV